MTGLPGLPALDRTLLPKPCTDLWPDLASEMGVGAELVVGQGSSAHTWDEGSWRVGKGPTSISHTAGCDGGGGREDGIWFCYLAVDFSPLLLNSKIPCWS